MGLIITLIKGIKTYGEYYFAVATVVGAIWGGFVVFDNWKDNNALLQKNVKSIMEQQIKQGKTDSILMKNQETLYIKINYLQETTSSIQSSYVKYIGNDKGLSKSDFINYMQGLSYDVKKNFLNYNPIPLSPFPPFQTLTVSNE